jgi:hypothetical protein
MIETIDDLIAYSETLSEPGSPHPPLSTPGLGDDELAVLAERFPDLPASYVDCLKRLAVDGREISFVRFSPPTFGDDSAHTFADRIARATEADAFEDTMSRAGLVEIGVSYTHPLTVQLGGDGRVLWLEGDPGDEPVVRDLAPSFCDLLLMVGRYDELLAQAEDADEPEPEPEDLVPEISRGIELNDDQRESWLLFLE